MAIQKSEQTPEQVPAYSTALPQVDQWKLLVEALSAALKGPFAQTLTREQEAAHSAFITIAHGMSIKQFQSSIGATAGAKENT